MALADSVQRLTEAEYLEIERAAEFKSEFFGGEMFAMSGGTRWHSLITANAIRALGNKLAGSKCIVFDSNLRVKVEATGLYTYPDVIISCDNPRFVDYEMDTLLNPTLLVEVLSESTETYDRIGKFENYRQIPSLREYVLIHQDEPRAEQYVRTENNDWLFRDTAGLENLLQISSLNISIPLAEIFARVEFPPAPLRQTPPRKRRP